MEPYTRNGGFIGRVADFGSTETYGGGGGSTSISLLASFTSGGTAQADVATYTYTLSGVSYNAGDQLIFLISGEGGLTAAIPNVTSISYTHISNFTYAQSIDWQTPQVSQYQYSDLIYGVTNSSGTGGTLTVNLDISVRRMAVTVYKISGTNGVAKSISSFDSMTLDVNDTGSMSTTAAAGDHTVFFVYSDNTTGLSSGTAFTATSDIPTEHSAAPVEDGTNGEYISGSRNSTVSETLTTSITQSGDEIVAMQATFSGSGSAASYDDTITGSSGGAPDFRWKFNGTTGETGGHFTTPTNGTPTYTTGLIPTLSDQSANMSGSEYLLINSDPLINTGTGYSWTKRSISFWFNTDTTGSGTYPCIWEEGGNINWMSIYFDNGLIYANLGEASASGGHATASVSTGTTYHCLVTFDLTLGSNDIKIYLNGSLAGQATSSVTALPDHNGDVRLGSGWARYHLGNNITYASYDGRLQDLCYWNEVALTSTDANNIYTVGTTIPVAGNKKNSGIWDLQAVLESKSSTASGPNLPAGTLVYSPLVGTAGATSVSGYYYDGSTFVESANLFSVRSGASASTAVSGAQTNMNGSTTSILSNTLSNSNVDGWELLSAASTAMEVGASPLSIEFWWYNRGISGPQWGRIFSWGEYLDNGSGMGFEQYSTTTSQFSVYESNGPSGGNRRALFSAYTIPANQWHHIYWAVDPNPSAPLSYFALNGNMIWTSTTSFITNFTADYNLVLGAHCDINAAERGYGGFYQEFIARNNIPYTSNFTPSTTPLLPYA